MTQPQQKRRRTVGSQERLADGREQVSTGDANQHLILMPINMNGITTAATPARDLVVRLVPRLSRQVYVRPWNLMMGIQVRRRLGDRVYNSVLLRILRLLCAMPGHQSLLWKNPM